MFNRYCNFIKPAMQSGVVFGLLLLVTTANAIDLGRLYHHRNGIAKKSFDNLLNMYRQSYAEGKRGDGTFGCPPIKPFSCPGNSEVCLPLQYICDGSPDCPDGYDEGIKLCTAALRPPVDEIVDFLRHLVQQNGIEFLTKLFGEKAEVALEAHGGVEKVAVALSESKTAEDFGHVMHLLTSDIQHLREVMLAVENGNTKLLLEMGIQASAIGDVKFFLDKLVETGFLNRS
ncbi:PREDICTED: IDLSRF-like peptide [Priapulus caudatus]|uniref:IDLSRF-like peptide n=1 Tax=Priapulus caudatus TaxID=37621 RepID=A0ABM1FAM8_PRICU|nr:PREDICTED: IDLSRF-like peptide [Priapulus caudatus]